MEGKNIKLIAFLMALACLASGCGKGDEEKEEPHTLREYALGGETVAALQPEEEDVQGVKDLTQVYRYSGLENAGATVQTYVEQLTSAENGFSVVDANFVRAEKPDFTQESGTVRLARRLEVEEEAADAGQDEAKTDDKTDEEKETKTDDKADAGQDEAKTDDKADEKKEAKTDDKADDQSDKEAAPAKDQAPAPKKWLITVQIDWRAGNCVVTVDQKEGSITSPPKKAGASAAKTMTLTGAVDHFKGISPASLGLAGASMEEYQVQSLDGIVMVDGAPCMQLRVYSNQNVEKTNEFMGSFLMTSDGAHIYRLNEGQRTVEEIKDIKMVAAPEQKEETPDAAADQAGDSPEAPAEDSAAQEP